MKSEENEIITNNSQGREDVSEKNAISKEELDILIKSTTPITKTLTVNKDNFRGEVTFSFHWANQGGIFYCYTSQYRITKLNGQEGGYRANLHFAFSSVQYWGNDSPDALWQDGAWHSYGRGGWIGANGRAHVFIKFVFDKPGSDPSGEANFWADFKG